MSVSNQQGFLGFPIPIGTILPYAGVVLPETYLVCNGQTFNANEYPELYRVLGNSNVIPDTRGGFIGGHGQRTPQIQNTINNFSAPLTITTDEMPSFTATVTDTNITGQVGRIENGVFVVRGAIHNEPTNGRTDGDRFDGLQEDTPTINAYDVTVTSFTGTYNGGEQPANGIVGGFFGAEPAYVDIQYIVKAKY